MIEGIFVHKEFIIKELPISPHNYISVYLATVSFPNKTVSEIAEFLYMPENEVLKAWGYWVGRNVLDNSYLNSSANNNTNNNINNNINNNTNNTSIVHLDAVTANKEIKEKNNIEESNNESSNGSNKVQIESNESKDNLKKYIAIKDKPDYTIEELNEYMKDEEMADFMQNIHNKLARPLKDFEISLFISFHDYYGLPLDVIDVMVDYILKEGKKNLNYMEKVAMTWADANIQSVEQAINFAKFRKSNHKAVMIAFGKGHETPLEHEIEFMKIWFQEYNMPIDLVTLACKRTIDKIEKPSFKYANGIIKKWYDNNVKTLEEVEVSDEVFKSKKITEEQKKSNDLKNNTKVKPSKFSNFEQRNWDFDQLDQLQKQQRDKW